MAYEVLARKWRPQQFADVLGQDHVSRTLINAIESKRVAHAYLFVGPRGTGKTSTARIMAKALNCEKGPTAKPCDACTSCREIMSGSSLDVIEIDGASNNGVEQVRALRENVHYAPARGPFKIYIIDEVHMLSGPAFNALLKTLEEPPAHVKFVFATTEPQKVPATVLSRCQRFDLRRIPLREIVEQLRRIATSEKVTVEESALLAIARGAEGGMRDAESALDQLIAFRGTRIEEADVLSVFGLVSWTALEAMVSAVLTGDVAEVLRRLAAMDEQGKDLQRLVVELIGQFRNLLVALYAPDAVGGMDLTEAQAASLRKQTEGSSPGRVLRVVDILTEADTRMRQALSRRTLLETALIRCARAATTVTIDELVQQVQQLRASLGGGAPIEKAAASPERAVPASQPPRTAAPAPTPATSPGRVAEPRAAPSAPARPAGDEAAYLKAHWGDFTDRVGAYASLVKGYLLDARVVSVEAERVVIGFDPEFGDNVVKIDTTRTRQAIQKILGTMLNRPVHVEFTVLQGTAVEEPLPSDHKLQGSAAGSKVEKAAAAPKAPAASRSPTGGPKGPEDLLQRDSVRKVIDAFNGAPDDLRG